MTRDLLLAFATFAFVTSITPGPNNLMLMASGANFGIRRTIPHMLGVSGGFCLMVCLVGLGLAGVFETFPMVHRAFQVLSVLYLLWLAWKIATAAPKSGDLARGKPFTFLQAAAFQWVNPKAWTMALTAVTVYSPGTTFVAVALTAFIFGAINLPTSSTWIFLGKQMTRILTNPVRLRVFNAVMAVLLVASLLPVLA